MAKEIVPHKIIISLSEDGMIKEGVFQYRLKIDGVLQSKFNTVGLQSINTEAGDVIEKAINIANQAEGVI